MRASDFKVGDRVKGKEGMRSYTGTVRYIDNSVHVERDDKRTGGGKSYNGKYTWICQTSRTSNGDEILSDGSKGTPLEMDAGGKKMMELKNIKKENLKEAKKQVEAEKQSAEITFARQKLRSAQDEIDRLDREIKEKEQYKKPHLEIIAQFK